MTNILVFGAGKSSSYLIKYLLENASRLFWQITVADANINAALERISGHSFGSATQIDIFEEGYRTRLVSNADIVISLLPPSLHIVVAMDCLKLRKNLVTASYVSDEIRALHVDVRNEGLLFMNEIGLDPGLDHMSAMKIVHQVERLGGDIFSFKSYCGGLISPKSDNNPWHYKISWNPRNIVNAGKGGGHFLLDGVEYHVPYEELFRKSEMVRVPGAGVLSAYANRDSLAYRSSYGFDKVRSMLRATFRHPDFCVGWNALVQLGITDDTILYDTSDLRYYDWFMAASKQTEGKTPEDRIHQVSDQAGLAIELIGWLQLFSKNKIPRGQAVSSASILQAVLEEKWIMETNDKDMIVMHHEFEYGRRHLKAKLSSTLVVEGEDKTYTAMSKTVGLPMAVFTKLFLTGKIRNLVGVQIPVLKEVYKPILKELVEHGIDFEETYLH